MVQTSRRAWHMGLILACGMTAGCMGDMSNLREKLPFSGGKSDAAPAAQTGPALDAKLTDGSNSQIIGSLLNRQSALRPGAFRQVADAVMAANTRRAEAELRAAVLTSEATQKNWLPSLGPRLSLTSLGTVAAGLLVDVALFDSGKRRAERAVARADIEVAAAALSENSNDRVRQALELYLDAEAARARAAVNQNGMERMTHFEWVMSERVRGGINDRGDLQVVRQRLAQMRSDLAGDREKSQGARAELAAMSALPLDGIRGLSEVALDGANTVPLAVLKAEAIAKRSDARADAAKAGFFPGLSLGVDITSKGAAPGLNVDFGNGIGPGSGARRQAIEAERDAAKGRLGEAQEASARALRSLQGQLAEAERRHTEARAIAAHANENYNLFAAQLEAGRRAVPDVIGVFETKLRTARAAVDLEYKVARLRVKIAALRGVLVSGDKV